MKKVSVIIPVYNGEVYIKHTINRILLSSYSNIELILVNDGSTDDSLSICEKMRANDSRIFIYSKDNGGVVSARNFGVMKATGDYLCFCDQDDIVEPEMYSKQIEAIENFQSDFCMCSTGRIIDGKKSTFETSQDRFYEGNQILEELLYPLLFNGYKVPIKMSEIRRYPHIWCCMFKRDFILNNKIQFRAYINFEDDLLVKIEALSKAARVSTISYTGYYWRVNLKSETYAHKYVDKIKEKQQKCYEDMLSCISNKVLDKKVLELFTQVTFCKQYLEAIHNLTSSDVKKNYKFIRDYYTYTIYKRNFEHCITARKYLKKGRVKPCILLPLLSKKLTLISYLTEIILDHILLATLHSQTLTKLERYLKRN